LIRIGDETRMDEERRERTHFKAILYFGPSFSNSAITQSVMVGIPE